MTFVVELRLEILIAKFESLRMLEDDMICEFNAWICDINNESFALGTQILEKRLVKKALRLLPPKLANKAVTIKEARDLKIKKLEELMRFSRSFEIELEEDSNDRKNMLGFQS